MLMRRCCSAGATAGTISARLGSARAVILHKCKIKWTEILQLSMLIVKATKIMPLKRYVIPEAHMHGPPAAYGIAATPQTEALMADLLAGQPVSDADLTLVLRARDIEREVMTLRGLLAAGSANAGRDQHLKEEIVRLLSKVIMFRVGLARE